MAKWEIQRESKLPVLHNPIFLEGLPGIGNVGKIAVDFLIEELNARKLYSFFSHKFPHSVFINDNNLAEMPKIELYYKKLPGKVGAQGKGRDLLLLTGDIQPIDEESCYSFCEEILAMVRKMKCSMLITTGGIGLQHIPDKPQVYCTANDAAILRDFAGKDSGINRKIFGVVGPIVGVSGVLLGLGKRRGVKAVALMAETFGHPMYLGIKGAKELLRILETKYHLGIDLKKMSKEIIEVERELIKRTKEWEAAAHAGAKAKQKEAGYIG